MRHSVLTILREGVNKNNYFFSSLLLLRGPATPPPPLVVPWTIKILGPYLFSIAADAIRPKTDFTLETNRKKVKEKLLKTIQNPVFYLVDL